MNLAYVALDYLAAWNVLKHHHRKCEIDLRRAPNAEAVPPMRADDSQVFPVVAEYARFGERRHRAARLRHHLAADIHRINAAEEIGESPSHAARSAADF